MSDSPWFPLYVGDFETATRHFTPAEVGAYIRLLNHQWCNGEVPVDDGRDLCRILGTLPDELDTFERVLAKFPDGRNPRLALEQETRAKRSENGKKGGRPKKLNQNQTETSRLPDGFESEKAKGKPNAKPHSHSHSHSSSSSSTCAGEPCIDGYPTEAQAVAAGENMMVPAEVAKRWWIERDGTGWEWHGHPLPIHAWQSNLKSFSEKWKANEKRNQNNQRNAGRGTGATSGQRRPTRNAGTANDNGNELGFEA